MQFLDKHFECFGDTGFGQIFALDDCFVGLYAAHHVVGLDGKHFLQHVCRAVCFQCPHFHFTKTLSAELRFAAQRLLRNKAVRTCTACVNFVVYQVDQFEIVHVTDGYAVFKRFARTSVVQLHLTVNLARNGVDHAVFLKQLTDLFLTCSVEYGCGNLPAQHLGNKTKVNFQHLTDVHT